MSLATDVASIRTAIVAVLDGVTDNGRVHRYLRHVHNIETVTALFKDDVSGRLFGWQVSMAGELPAVTMRAVRTTLQFELHAYMAEKDTDNTEELLAAKVYDTMEALRANQQLGLPALLSGSGPADWIQSGHVKFGDVFCNYARLLLPVWLNALC